MKSSRKSRFAIEQLRYTQFSTQADGSLDQFLSDALMQEYFADYLALGPELFACSWPQPPPPVYGDNPKAWNSAALQRTSQCVLSVILSLKKRPLIRYDRQSSLAKRLADELHVCFPSDLFRSVQAALKEEGLTRRLSLSSGTNAARDESIRL